MLLFVLLAAAAVLGDTVNYWIGHYIGPRAFSGNVRFLKKEYLDRTQAFYEKHGGKTILLARFVPIVRTFAPFVAGVGKMRYGYFISYNIFGGILWTALFLFGGFFVGNLEIVKNNFSLIVIAIILISVLPAVFEIVKGYLEDKKAKGPPQPNNAIRLLRVRKINPTPAPPQKFLGRGDKKRAIFSAFHAEKMALFLN